MVWTFRVDSGKHMSFSGHFQVISNVGCTSSDLKIPFVTRPDLPGSVVRSSSKRLIEEGGFFMTFLGMLNMIINHPY